jgi:hypothetical protein
LPVHLAGHDVQAMTVIGPTLPSPPPARDGSYLRISCRQRRSSATV